MKKDVENLLRGSELEGGIEEVEKVGEQMEMVSKERAMPA